MGIYKWALLGLVALLVGCGEEKPTREESVAAIKKLGGQVVQHGKFVLVVLADTEITDAGLAHLRGLTGLEMLWLTRTKITDAGLVHLEGLTGLVELDIHGTAVTDAGVAKLKAALPKCSIER